MFSILGFVSVIEDLVVGPPSVFEVHTYVRPSHEPNKRQLRGTLLVAHAHVTQGLLCRTFCWR